MKFFAESFIIYLYFLISGCNGNNASEVDDLNQGSDLAQDDIYANMFQPVGGVQQNRLKGGAHAARGYFPYQLYIYSGEHRFCSASIIDKWFGLTAAHCVTEKNGSLPNDSTTATAGVINVDRPDEIQQTVQVSKVYILKEYAKLLDRSPAAKQADIAVLKFHEPFDFNKFVNKINLPENLGLEVKIGVFSGFGQNWKNWAFDRKTQSFQLKGGSDDRLRFAKANLLPRDQCENLALGLNFNKTICAKIIGNPGQNGLCSGDSGGPLATKINKKIYVIGVASAGFPLCNEVVIPGYYTRVSNYLGFIKKAMNDTVDETMIAVQLKLSDLILDLP